MQHVRLPRLVRVLALLALCPLLRSDSGFAGGIEPSPTAAGGHAAIGVPPNPAEGVLPPPWADADIGSPGIPGSADYANGTFTVTASGADIETTSDQFHYVYQPVSGDVTVIARVVSVQNTDPWAKAGVMIRETLDADSKHAMTVVTPGNGIAFQRRVTTGGLTLNTSGALVSAPYWVAIVRFGDTLTGYSSQDGLAWTQVDSETIPMAANVFVGLPLTSHNDGLLCTATFDNVSVGAGTCPPGDSFADGGFEDTDPGTLANPHWTAVSTQFGTPLCGNAPCGRTGFASAHTGAFWAWFGGTTGVGSEVASLSQAVTIPAGAPSVTLSFYLWVSAVSIPLTDTLEIQVDGVTQQTFTEPPVAEGDYSPFTVDLTGFADGASHTIRFLYTQPALGGTASFNVDDARLDLTCPGSPTLSPASLAADPVVNGNSNGNGVLEMNEDAIVDPGWHNGTAADFALQGTASSPAGPGPAIYAIPDPVADYGVIPAGTTKDCLTGTPNCYVVSISGVRTDQPVHFDATMDETVVPGLPPPVGQPSLVLKTWTLHVGQSFADVITDPLVDPFYRSIETLLHKGVTGGCSAGPPALFCPTQNVLRQEMAPFLLKGFLGSGYVPPACTPPGMFTDVPCPGLYTNFIEDLKTRGITAGCGDGTTYCPGANVLRQEMAVFLLKTLLGSGYVPPACTPPGQFADTPCPGQYTNWAEDLKTRGITAGCHGGVDFCPTDPVTRQEMAAFLTRTFGLVLYGP